MAKKKLHKKRRHNLPSGTQSSKQPKAVVATTNQGVSGEGFGQSLNQFVVQDLRKFVILATVFVLIELAIWLLFAHTDIGIKVYDLINL